jgi:hypothetical protein
LRNEPLNVVGRRKVDAFWKLLDMQGDDPFHLGIPP